MAGGTVNQNAINEGGQNGISVAIPPALARVTFAVNERGVVNLSGSVSLTTEVNGDVTRLSAIPKAKADIGFVQTAALTVYRRFDLDPVSASLSLATLAELSKFSRVSLGSAVADVVLDISGSANTVIRLAGTVGPSFLLDASLSRVSQLAGHFFTDYTLQDNGITTYVGLTGDTGVVLDTESSLSKMHLLSGEIGCAFGIDSDINVNRRVYVPDAKPTLTTTVTGDLSGLLRLSGDTNVEFINEAQEPFNARFDIDEVQAIVEFEASGELIANRLRDLGPIDTDVSFGVSGALAELVFMNGGFTISFNTSGRLINLTEIVDVEERLMVRPFQDTDMVA